MSGGEYGAGKAMVQLFAPEEEAVFLERPNRFTILGRLGNGSVVSPLSDPRGGFWLLRLPVHISSLL